MKPKPQSILAGCEGGGGHERGKAPGGKRRFPAPFKKKKKNAAYATGARFQAHKRPLKYE